MKEKFDRNKPHVNIGEISIGKTPNNVTNINDYKKIKRTREFLEQQRAIIETLKDSGLLDTTSFKYYTNIDCGLETIKEHNLDTNKVNYYSNSKNNSKESGNTHQDYSLTRRTLHEDEVFIPIDEVLKPKKR